MAEGHRAPTVTRPVAVVWNGEVFVGVSPRRGLSALRGFRPWAEAARRGRLARTRAERSGRAASPASGSVQRRGHPVGPRRDSVLSCVAVSLRLLKSPPRAVSGQRPWEV